MSFFYGRSLFVTHRHGRSLFVTHRWLVDSASIRNSPSWSIPICYSPLVGWFSQYIKNTKLELTLVWLRRYSIPSTSSDYLILGSNGRVRTIAFMERKRAHELQVSGGRWTRGLPRNDLEHNRPGCRRGRRRDDNAAVFCLLIFA